jgi:MFS transporter, MFS domain-containing protein family, molybdate-anion transporter
MEFYTVVFCTSLIGCVAVQIVRKLLEGSQDSAIESIAGFKQFQWQWLTVYYVVMGADWLQGPYVYALYEHYGFERGEIAQLFIAGYFSSMIFGTVAGSISDKLGRKWGCLLFGVIYSFSCATKLSSSFSVLLLGRFAGGIGTSLLFSVFEAWMVHEHHDRSFPEAALQQTFSLATLGNGVVAIAAGLVASFVADEFGFVAPFMVSLGMLVVATVIVWTTWTENYGDARIELAETLSHAFADLRADLRVPLLGITQSLFEGAMYTFVFMWTPALQADASHTDEPLPFGVIFASYMVCTMIGSALFSIATRFMSLEVLGRLVLACATVALLVPTYFADRSLVIAAFLVFEICCGMYWPCFGSLRGQYLPARSRSAVMNLFRVPLNLLVVLVLVRVKDLDNHTVFAICSTWMAIACVLQTVFIWKTSKK